MSIGNQSYDFIDFDFIELLRFKSSVLRLPPLGTNLYTHLFY